MKAVYILSIPCLLFSLNTFSQSSEVAKGNEEYEKKRYRNAESAYRESLKKDSKQFAGNYNLGNSLYRQNKYEEAGQQFLNAAANNNDPQKQARAMYNMGNALLKSEKYQESIEAYKRSLRLNPDDENARYNLSYALKKLKQQQQQQQQQKDQKDQNQDQKKQQQQQQDKNKQQQQDQNKNQQQQPQDQKKDQQKPEQQKQPKLSKEEAERMLRALKNDEKDLQKEKAKKFPASNVNPEKNW